MEYLKESSTLYVAYRAARSNPAESNSAFFKRVFDFADSHRVDRFVLDVRDNSGGESYYNRQIVLGIVRRPKLDRRGKLYVIIGRRTFSAAQSLVNELERYTNAIFVGEPTGNAPHFFGDHRPLVLANSGMTVMVSTQWWQNMDARDQRPFVPPAIFAELSSSDYRNNVDPAMRAIDRRAISGSLGARLSAALKKADLALARKQLEDFNADVANKYASAEEEINREGFEQLRAGKPALAVELFKLSVSISPQSWVAHDGLGEAYERTRQPDLAIASYQRSLQLAPQMESPRNGLIRLGRRQ
jgi:tetratricopeptide (TPR) repeat protein